MCDDVCGMVSDSVSDDIRKIEGFPIIEHTQVITDEQSVELLGEVGEVGAIVDGNDVNEWAE